MFIQILVDNPNSWILPFLNQLREQIEDLGHDTSLIYSHDEVKNGDILCLLSCIKIFKNLNLNKHNLVVHESNLPKGKGWSPLTWQILDGANKIPVTLFEATNSVDAGQIYSQLDIDLDGTELIDEIREKQAILTNKLIIDFVKLYPNNVGINQIGIETFYKKRKPEDSVLDIERSLSEQFNLLRVCDNERYPAYFEIKGIKYYLKIYKNVERY
jgi:methionyl-tRNA formyltransferase